MMILVQQHIEEFRVGLKENRQREDGALGHSFSCILREELLIEILIRLLEDESYRMSDNTSFL